MCWQKTQRIQTEASSEIVGLLFSQWREQSGCAQISDPKKLRRADEQRIFQFRARKQLYSLHSSVSESHLASSKKAEIDCTTYVPLHRLCNLSKLYPLICKTEKITLPIVYSVTGLPWWFRW